MDRMIVKKLDHDVPENVFDCGNSSINKQIIESYMPTLLQYAYAYQVSIKGRGVVGYYMIRLRSIEMEHSPKELQEYSSSLVHSCGALHIHYIAVDKKYQGKTLGTNILKGIIVQGLKLCEHWPITIITLDALKEKYTWYVERGFRPFDEKDLTTEKITIPMYMSCIINQEAVKNYGYE